MRKRPRPWSAWGTALLSGLAVTAVASALQAHVVIPTAALAWRPRLRAAAVGQAVDRGAGEPLTLSRGSPPPHPGRDRRPQAAQALSTAGDTLSTIIVGGDAVLELYAVEGDTLDIIAQHFGGLVHWVDGLWVADPAGGVIASSREWSTPAGGFHRIVVGFIPPETGLYQVHVRTSNETYVQLRRSGAFLQYYGTIDPLFNWWLREGQGDVVILELTNIGVQAPRQLEVVTEAPWIEQVMPPEVSEDGKTIRIGMRIGTALGLGIHRGNVKVYADSGSVWYQPDIPLALSVVPSQLEILPPWPGSGDVVVTSGGVVVAASTVRDGATGLALGPDDVVYAAGPWGVVRRRDGLPDDVVLSAPVNDVVVTPDGTVYASAADGLWRWSEQRGAELVRQFGPIMWGLEGIAFDGRYVWMHEPKGWDGRHVFDGVLFSWDHQTDSFGWNATAWTKSKWSRYGSDSDLEWLAGYPLRMRDGWLLSGQRAIHPVPGMGDFTLHEGWLYAQGGGVHYRVPLGVAHGLPYAQITVGAARVPPGDTARLPIQVQVEHDVGVVRRMSGTLYVDTAGVDSTVAIQVVPAPGFGVRVLKDTTIHYRELWFEVESTSGAPWPTQVLPAWIHVTFERWGTPVEVFPNLWLETDEGMADGVVDVTPLLTVVRAPGGGHLELDDVPLALGESVPVGIRLRGDSLYAKIESLTLTLTNSGGEVSIDSVGSGELGGGIDDIVLGGDSALTFVARGLVGTSRASAVVATVWVTASTANTVTLTLSGEAEFMPELPGEVGWS